MKQRPVSCHAHTLRSSTSRWTFWMKSHVVALTLLAGIASPLFASDEVSVQDKAAILEAAANVRHAILSKDTKALLATISKSHGLGCTDTRYSYQRVLNDLRDQNSYLYQGLFDTKKFRERCGAYYPAEYPAKSDLDFFEHVTDSADDISFAKDNNATVTFRSSVKGYYPAVYSFQKEDGQWKLVYGLIIGRCTCG